MVLGKGQLGSTLEDLMSTKKDTCLLLSRPELDVNDLTKLIDVLEEFKPTQIINTVAFTNVDLAESKVDDVLALNVNFPAKLAALASNRNIRLVLFSTDQVFDGDADHPYNELDVAKPTNIYGKSKFAQDQVIDSHYSDVLVYRTSWMYGNGRGNFVSKILALKEGQEIKVVVDQISNPTEVYAFAKSILFEIENEIGLKGIYHLTGTGACTKFEFAQEILRVFERKNNPLIPVQSDHFVDSAKRPAYSSLDNAKIFTCAKELILPDWQESLMNLVGKGIHD